MSAFPRPVFTIGHSTGSLDQLISSLQSHGIQAVADVRSSPYSARMPWFNSEPLARGLGDHDIQYVFMGTELGGRGSGLGAIGPDGQVNYAKIAQTEAFNRGLERVMGGRDSMTIALLCSERDPLECHRGLLVARHLSARGVPVRHILAESVSESHEQFEARLLSATRMQPELMRTDDEVLDEAYQRQSARVAYRQPTESAEGGEGE